MPFPSRSARALFGALLGLGWFAAPAAHAGVTQLVSVTSSSAQGGDESRFPSVSEDGRYIAFVSRAPDLVPNDNNGQADVFLRDRHLNQTIRVSVSSAGTEAHGYNSEAALSADGRHVAFSSDASDLVDNDGNGLFDIFVRDLATSSTVRVSVGPLGLEADAFSGHPSLSRDGMLVAFESTATNLVVPKTNGVKNVFVYDRATGVTQRVSIGLNAQEADGVSDSAVISADGRYVAFRSAASNLVASDTNATSDVFVYDRLLSTTVRVSVGPLAQQSDGDSRYPSISADGHYVSFTSLAGNIVDGGASGVTQVFVHNCVSGANVLASIGTAGEPGNDFTFQSSISGDGCSVAFQSLAFNLVSGDTNNRSDVFVRDWCHGVTRRVSRCATGGQSGDNSYSPSVNGDGRIVAFESYATNLVSGDANQKVDTFVRDARPVADFDDDGDVDGDDRAHLAACSTRAGIAQINPLCADAHLDGDADVDMDDFGIFQRCYKGAGVVADPECGIP